LHAADIAPCERFTDGQTDEFLACEDIRDDFGLELKRTEAKDRR
jgi:hypothetical protein